MMLVAASAQSGAEIEEWGQSDSSAPAGGQPALGPPEEVAETDPEGISLPTTDWLRLAGSVLRPRNSTVTFTSSGGGGCIQHTGGSTSTVWNTGVYLPQGATVTFVRMYFDDTSPANSRGWFTVYDLYGDAVQEWGVSSSGSSGNGFEDTSAIDHQIDYRLYSYMLNWRPVASGSEMQLCGFRIFYDK